MELRLPRLPDGVGRRRSVKPRTQSSSAVSADGESWLLLNASIDLRQQVLATPALQPKGQGRHSPIAAALLTNTDVDHAAGLLALRERQPFTLWGTQDRQERLQAHPPAWPAHDVAGFQAVRAAGGSQARIICSSRQGAAAAEEGEVKTDQIGEGTVGVVVEAGGRKLVYAPGCAQVTGDLKTRIAEAHALFFDGTLFSDDEMIANGLGDKTGRRMGHMPVSGPGGSLEELSAYAHMRRILIHINNSNPILIEGSPEEAKVKAAGWDIAFDGMEVTP